MLFPRLVDYKVYAFHRIDHILEFTFRVYNARTLSDNHPVRAHEVAGVIASNVLEYLPNPETVFAEVFRVLKRSGIFLAKIPNKSHHMPTIARMTPHAFHQWIASMRGRSAEATFPTRYRANTPADIHKLAVKTGFSVEAIELIEGRPEYLRISTLTYS